jgi:ATP-binding cassette subfamily B multidrug efflux pump
MKLLLAHLRPYASRVGLVVALQLVQTLATLYLPTLNADIIDNGVARGDSGYVLRTGFMMLAFTVLQILCTAAAVYLSTKIAMALGRDLRAAVFGTVQRLSVRELGGFGAPSLVTRTTNDVHQVQMLVLTGLTTIVIAPVMGVGGLAMALDQDVPLSMLLLAILPVLGGSLAVVIIRAGPMSRVVQRRIDRVNHVVREQITGIRIIRAFVRDERERARFAEANAELTATGLRLGRLMALMKPATILIIDGSSIAVLWFAGYRIDDGAMQVGSLIAFLHYLLQILQAVLIATGAFLMAPRALASAQRIQEVLRTKSSLTVPVTPVTTLPGRGRLDLLDVEVRYPGAEEPVLRGIDLTAWPGETAAIIGPTGAGKTTMLDLVPRFYEPTGGRITLDGTDIAHMTRAELRTHIGMVLQDTWLTAGTIADNIAYGVDDATREQIVDAARATHADHFIRTLPRGYDTTLDEDGGNLSAGEKQLITIARAFLPRPAILVLDEATSSVDTRTEMLVQRAMATLRRGRTSFVIAHRLSTIRDADTILVMDSGRIAEQGTHDQLLAADGCYSWLYQAQFAHVRARRSASALDH